MALGDQILDLLRREPGMTDREITDRLRGASALQQPINQTCRNLETKGRLVRRHRADRLIGNYLAAVEHHPIAPLRKEPHRTVIEPADTRVTADDLSQWRRMLLRYIDELDGGQLQVGIARRIRDLEASGQIPRRTAAYMRAVTETRNASEYEDATLTAAEAAAVTSAWRAVQEWAVERGLH